MSKLLKFLGWLAGILIVLLLGVIVLVPMFVDPNEHKDRIVAEVKKATGRDLTIGGDIGLSVIPWLGLDLNGLSLSNAAGFGDKNFAAVKRAKVRVKLIPLVFRQTLEVDTVELDGLELNLAKSKDGTSNWDDLSSGGESAQEETPSTGGSKIIGYSIGGVEISDAHVVWDDQSAGQFYEIKGLNLETGSLSPGRPVEVGLKLTVESRQPQMQVAIDLSAMLNAYPDAQKLMIEEVLLKLHTTGEGLPKGGVKAEMNADLSIDHAADTLEVSQFIIRSDELALHGSLAGRDISVKPAFEGHVRMDKFSPRKWMQNMGIDIPETADPNVLSSLGFSARLTSIPNHVALGDLVMSLDDTNIKGKFEVITPDTPGYRFDLAMDSLNLDRYLPPPSEADPAGNSGGRNEEPLFPVELLRQLDLSGNLQIKNLTVKNIRADAITLKVYAKNGKLEVKEQVGRFYDGIIKGDVVVDARGKTPKLSIDQQASRILAGPLLRDLADSDKLEGSGGFNAKLNGSGQTVSQLKRSLNGSFDFSFKDGSVKGVNLARMIREAKGRFSGETVAVTREPEQTDFSELTGSAQIRNGIINNRDLQAKSPFLRVNGSGKVNLVMENLDYTVRPVIVSSAKGQGGQGLDELVGIPIPIRFEGPWSKLDWKIDLAKVLEEQQKEKVKEKAKEEVGKKIEEKLPDLKEKLPEGLKGLF